MIISGPKGKIMMGSLIAVAVIILGVYSYKSSKNLESS